MDRIHEPAWVERSLELLASYERWLGEPLVPEGTAQQRARSLWEAPFVVVAHGTQADPVLNYANQAALALWETDLESLLQMPSRLTAEPMHRDERAEMLRRTSRDGYIDDYRGVRISTTGRRFLIERATVWNVLDTAGQPAGQAATFSDWSTLSDSA
ncbi:MAG: MEKHLA domain-containing protein [Planctomycetales bacterium]|nr:MEKHLA domain-containing protein [Planctomycetales bacterium]